MSSANFDLVRSIYADWERGDFSSTDWADPGIEPRRAGGLEPNTATGVAALGDFWRGALSPWRGYRASAHDYREIDNERVLVLARHMGTGKASGVPISKEGANLFHLRGGKVTKLVLYWDADRALADLGLAAD
jgi:ketosteroid isomerase-like protein